MKKNLLINIAIILLCTGCNDYTIRTVVHEDGSFERTIICVGDSSGLSQLRLPYIFDSLWTMTIEERQDSAGGQKKIVTTAHKNYRDEAELRNEMARGKDTAKNTVIFSLNKHFQWFYTYYHYHETISAFGFFRYLPIDSFFTPVEIRTLRDGNDSLLKNRYEHFLIRNVIEEFSRELKPFVSELHDPSFPISLIDEKKDHLVNAVIEANANTADEFVKACQKAYQTPAVKKLRTHIIALNKKIEKKLEQEANYDLSYHNEVVLPGILVEANSAKIEGNKITWEVKSDRYLDYDMIAESRTVNLWAIILTSAIGLIILIALILPLIWKRN